jgi:hypothetical protein
MNLEHLASFQASANRFPFDFEKDSASTELCTGALQTRVVRATRFGHNDKSVTEVAHHASGP